MRQLLADVMDKMTTVNTGLQGEDAGCLFSLLYADDSTIRSLGDMWLQNANHYFCILFRDCISMKPNTKKIESMSFHPGAIQD